MGFILWFGYEQVYWVSAALFASTDGSVYADVECYAEYVTGSHPTDADSWGCKCHSFRVIRIE